MLFFSTYSALSSFFAGCDPGSYNIFEGNTFEGHTLLPVLEGIQRKYGLIKPTVIADAAMLSKKNLDNLAKEKY